MAVETQIRPDIADSSNAVTNITTNVWLGCYFYTFTMQVNRFSESFNIKLAIPKQIHGVQKIQDALYAFLNANIKP